MGIVVRTWISLMGQIILNATCRKVMGSVCTFSFTSNISLSQILEGFKFYKRCHNVGGGKYILQIVTEIYPGAEKVLCYRISHLLHSNQGNIDSEKEVKDGLAMLDICCKPGRQVLSSHNRFPGSKLRLLCKVQFKSLIYLPVNSLSNWYQNP